MVGRDFDYQDGERQLTARSYRRLFYVEVCYCVSGSCVLITDNLLGTGSHHDVLWILDHVRILVFLLLIATYLISSRWLLPDFVRITFLERGPEGLTWRHIAS